MFPILVAKLFMFFLIMACGFALVKSKILAPQDVRGLSRITLYLVIPCVILRAFQVEWTAAVGRGLLFSLGAALLFHLFLFLLIWPMRHWIGLNEVEILSVIYPNAGNLTIPLIAATLGWEYVIYSSCFLAVQQFLLWSHGRMVMQENRTWDWKTILCNVNILSVLVGIVILMTRFRFPGPIQDGIRSIADMVAPVTMLISGILLASTKLSVLRAYPRCWIVFLLRLIAVPLILVFAAKLCGATGWIPDGSRIFMVNLFAVVTPPATSLILMAEVYHRDAIYTNLLNVACTVLFLFTVPLILKIYLLLNP